MILCVGTLGSGKSALLRALQQYGQEMSSRKHLFWERLLIRGVLICNFDSTSSQSDFLYSNQAIIMNSARMISERGEIKKNTDKILHPYMMSER